MAINVMINAVNLGIDAQNPAELILLVELADNPKLPLEIRVLGSTITPTMVGFVVSQLLFTLGKPSLLHVDRTPAVLHLENDDWTLTNFLDETKQFNARAVVAKVQEAVDNIASTTDAGAESTTT